MGAWRKFLLLEVFGLLATAAVTLVGSFIFVVAATGDRLPTSAPGWLEILDVVRFTAIITAALATMIVVVYGIPTYFVLMRRDANGLFQVIVAGALPGALLAFEVLILSLYAMACGIAIALIVHVCWRKIVDRRFGYTDVHAAEATVDQ